MSIHACGSMAPLPTWVTVTSWWKRAVVCVEHLWVVECHSRHSWGHFCKKDLVWWHCTELGHHELRSSVGPMLNISLWCVRVLSNWWPIETMTHTGHESKNKQKNTSKFFFKWNSQQYTEVLLQSRSRHTLPLSCCLTTFYKPQNS